MTRKLNQTISLLLLPTIFLGCNAPIFQPEVLKVTITPYTNYSHILEWQLAMEKKDALPTPDNNPNPGPTPSVKVGDTCPVCDGRGKSGDGINPCDPCKGDGKVHEGDPILLPTETPTKEEEKVPGKGEITTLPPVEKLIPETLTPAPKENIIPAPTAPKEEPTTPKVEKTYTYLEEYSVYWNGRNYYWDDAKRAFVNQLGNSISFASMPNFHPSTFQHIQMGCNTGRCTLVPITKITKKVEVPANEPGPVQRSTPNGRGSN